MIQKIYLSINNLPKNGGQPQRVYQVKSYFQLRQQAGPLALREGIDLEGAAKKLKLAPALLPAMGITENGIDISKLRKALLENIPKKLALRADEKRTPENAFFTIVGRLGRESQVLQPLDMVELIKFRGLSEKTKAGLTYESVKTWGDLDSQTGFLADLAKELYPPEKEPYSGFLYNQYRFAAGVAYRLNHDDPYTLADFIHKLAGHFQPGNFAEQREFTELAIEHLYSLNRFKRAGKKFRMTMAERLDQRFNREISTESITLQGKKRDKGAGSVEGDFITRLEIKTARAAGIRFNDPSNQGEFVADVAQDYLPDPQAQRRLIEAVANRLHAQDALSRAEMLAVALRQLRGNNSTKDPLDYN